MHLLNQWRDKLISHANVKAQFRRLGARRCILLESSDVWTGETKSIIGFARMNETLFRLGGLNALVLGLENHSATEQVLVQFCEDEYCEHLRDALIDFQRKTDVVRWKKIVLFGSQRKSN